MLRPIEKQADAGFGDASAPRSSSRLQPRPAQPTAWYRSRPAGPIGRARALPQRCRTIVRSIRTQAAPAMKTLYLVRHAKASRDDPALADRDRPLNDRGERDAAAMAQRLAARGAGPERLLSSPAKRALATARYFAAAFGIVPQKIVVDDRLYAGSAGGLLAVIQSLDDRQRNVMLFGHNPEFSNLAGRLSGQFVDLPTCGVAELRFDSARWADVGAAAPVSSKLHAPKD